jgi:hypothetical protein
MLNLPISREGFLWAFSITSQINRVPLAANFILQKYEPPFTLGSFRAAVEQGGMKIRQKAVPNSQLGKLPLPCLVAMLPPVQAVSMAVNGDTAVACHAVREYQIAMVESMDDRWVVLAEACCRATITLTREAFEKRFAGEALIISPHAPIDSGVKPMRGLPRKTEVSKPEGRLGTAWFMPQPDWLRGIFRTR